MFLSYGEKNRDFVELLALRLRSDARLSFWFAPWHSIPGVAIQEQMEHALQKTKACAVFLTSELIEGWQNEQMRIAIQRRIDEDSTYRVIPVLLPGILSSKKLELPAFLRRYEMIQFDSYDDDLAFKATY